MWRTQADMVNSFSSKPIGSVYMCVCECVCICTVCMESYFGNGRLQRQRCQLGQAGPTQSIRCNGAHIEAATTHRMQRATWRLLGLWQRCNEIHAAARYIEVENQMRGCAAPKREMERQRESCTVWQSKGKPLGTHLPMHATGTTRTCMGIPS